jgi:hypothetical protein
MSREDLSAYIRVHFTPKNVPPKALSGFGAAVRLFLRVISRPFAVKFAICYLLFAIFRVPEFE